MFKVGDRVVDVVLFDMFQEIPLAECSGEIVHEDDDNDLFILADSGDNWYASYSDLVLESVYHSELYRLMYRSEEDE